MYMKNLLLVTLLAITFVSAEAQGVDSLTTKKGHAILPQTGDIALGFDAIPLANLALNAIKIMGNNGQGAEHPGYVPGMDQVIVGKYFLSNTMALRARFGINTLKTTEKNYGDNPLTPSNPEPEQILLDKSSLSESNHFIGLGLERRRGYNRLHGIYGGEVLVGYSASKINNKYEVDFNETAQDSGFINPGAFRLLSAKDSGSFIFGVRGFVGVEYFVAPKISVGAEFGWSIGITTASRAYEEYEIWGIPPSGTEVTRYTERLEGDSSESDLGILVDNGISSLLGSSAAVMVHFLF
jgi:hypothetical protein